MTSNQGDDEDGKDQSEGSEGTDQKESKSLSPREKAKQETERNRPDVGYHRIERDTLREPWKQNTALKQTHSLKLSEMSIPDDSEIVKHFVIDEKLNRYKDSLRSETEKSVTELIDDLESAFAEDNEKDTRLILAQLAQAAKNDPSSCVTVVDPVTTAVEKDSQPVQAEALGILHEIAGVKPEALSVTIDPTIDILKQDVHPKLAVQALKLVNVLIPSHPEETSQIAPALTLLLVEDDLPDELVAETLAAIAEEKPVALTNELTELGAYITADDRPKTARKQVLVALGRTAKEQPESVTDVVPQLIDLLESQHTKIQVNSAGVLADVADAYPTVVESAIPQATELLASDDRKGQHNATSIIAHVAKTNPDAVQPALDDLIELLEADDVGTRINACWAVKHMKAESALPVLEDRRANDPDEEMRQTAKQAVEAISDHNNVK